MDENIWKIAQIVMWLLGLQTTIIIAIFGAMWASFNRKFDAIDKRFEKIESKYEKQETLLTDVDRRVFAMETMMHMKDCCMLKSDSHLKKVE